MLAAPSLLSAAIFVNNARHCTTAAPANKKIDPAKVKAYKQIKAS